MSYIPPIPAARNATSVILAINTARTPNASRDTLVIVTMNQVTTDGQTTTSNMQIDNSGGGTFTTVGVIEQFPNITGAGVGITLTEKRTVTFVVPPGSQYRIIESGAGTGTIQSIYELTL